MEESEHKKKESERYKPIIYHKDEEAKKQYTQF